MAKILLNMFSKKENEEITLENKQEVKVKQTRTFKILACR